MAMRRHSGFTLIELMIVVAVVAILAAIALPSFADQMRKSRRADALATLNDQQLRLERWRVDRPTYATYTLPAGISNNFYTFAIAGAGPAGYTLSATPQGNQAKDPCGTLQLIVANGQTQQKAATTGCF